MPSYGWLGVDGAVTFSSTTTCISSNSWTSANSSSVWSACLIHVEDIWAACLFLCTGEYIKNWRPRWFVLRSDGTFYGFKQKPTVGIEPLNQFKIERKCLYEWVWSVCWWCMDHCLFFFMEQLMSTYWPMTDLKGMPLWSGIYLSLLSWSNVVISLAYLLWQGPAMVYVYWSNILYWNRWR